MMYQDTLYGTFKVPDFIEELAATPYLQRLHRVSQDTLPMFMVAHPTPSRFEHSMGVMRLGMEILKHNPDLLGDQKLILASALLHDAGNPPFSHLAEPFLKQLTGKDGESFLACMPENSEAAKVLASLKLSLTEVVRLVTGETKPLATFLNGTLDIDNLDNVNRYRHASNGEIRFDGLRIASGFRFEGQRWKLPIEILSECQKWQQAREVVYGSIYANPHLAVCMMLYRAVDLAFQHGELSIDFFRMDDTQALAHLSGCNLQTAYLIQQLMAKKHYIELGSFETTEPSPKLRDRAKRINARREIADEFAKQINAPPELVCAYIGAGRDRRKIELPFVSSDGAYLLDNGKHPTIYRARLYVAPELEHFRLRAERFLAELIA